MKNIKKFLLTMAMTMALGTSAFAASGFEFLLNVPFGLNVGIPTKETKDLGGKDTHMGVDVGVDAQIGYMISVKDGFGISLLAELGYSFDSYGYGYSEASGDTTTTVNATTRVSFWNDYHISGKSRTIITVGSEDTRTEVSLKRKDITDLFSPSVIGYVKVTFDYYLFFTDNIGMNFGLYLGGDFAPKLKNTKIGTDAFDFGLQLGFRFGPKA